MTFEVSEEDLQFYDKISPVIAGKKYLVPTPIFCPDCRYQRRLVQRNERNLYRRKCTATDKDIVSIFSSDKPMKVYSQDYWWSDHWSPYDFARDFDFSRPFFDQFRELFHQVPLLALNNARSENCEFTNQSQDNKNSYLIVASNHCEDCYFSMWLQQCINCVDSLYLENCELCYEVLNAKNCYNVVHSENIESCSDSAFLKDCIGCKNCFGCVNLHHKEYYFFNEPCTKEEYFQKIAGLDLEVIQEKFKKFSSAFIKKYYTGKSIENSTGDYIQEVKNSFCSYNCRKTEDIQYCQDAWDARNCFDITETLTNDVCLELEGSCYNFNSAFSMKIDHTSDVFYSSHCYTGKNLFGCVGLRQSEYCILNKQCSKEEYEKLVPKIIEYMIVCGEWGEHFPKEVSIFAYNETVAQEYFPLSREDALKQGYQWKDSDFPLVSKDFPVCVDCGKNFKLIDAELKFYQKMGLSNPKKCGDCRHKARMALRNPRKLWARKCAKCAKDLWSSYAPDRFETVYCEECYLKEVV